MQDEIFGPILPVKTYQSIDEVVGYVNEHDRPLGLYYFGNDGDEKKTVLERTTSGGVTVNDVVMHVSMEDLPFGGVGPSGMGSYHGIDGFRTFSHAKAVYTDRHGRRRDGRPEAALWREAAQHDDEADQALKVKPRGARSGAGERQGV